MIWEPNKQCYETEDKEFCFYFDTPSWGSYHRCSLDKRKGYRIGYRIDYYSLTCGRCKTCFSKNYHYLEFIRNAMHYWVQYWENYVE